MRGTDKETIGLLRACVTNILQPVELADPDSETQFRIGADEGLGLILRTFEEPRATDEYLDALLPLAREQANDWSALLAQEVALLRDPPELYGTWRDFKASALRRLWFIARGDPDFQMPDDDQNEARLAARRTIDRLQAGEPSPSLAIIMPLRAQHRQLLRVEAFRLDETITVEAMINNHIIIMFFESLRQQLISRAGFTCPYEANSSHCDCPLNFRRWLQTLTRLAEHGLFGPGLWFGPTCRL